MIFKFLNKSFYISFSIVALTYFLDRFTKIYVIQLDKNNLGSDIFNSAYLNITLIWNKGIAFGLFSFTEAYLYNFLSLIISIIIIILVVMSFKSPSFKKYSLFIIFFPQLIAGPIVKYNNMMSQFDSIENNVGARSTDSPILDPPFQSQKHNKKKLKSVALTQRKGQTKFSDTIGIASKTKDGLLKLSPFYFWSDKDLDFYMKEHRLKNEFDYFDPTKVEEKRECGLHE